MSHLDPKRPATRSELRQFAWLVGGAFLVLGTLAFLRHRSVGVFGTLLGLGCTLVLAGVIVPMALASVYTNWMRLAVLLSRVTTPIFMGVIYFVVLAPIGLIMRAAGWRVLSAPRGASAWKARPVGERMSDLERQF